MKTTTLCHVPTCTARDRHGPQCDDGRCRGCLPRRADDGLVLCRRHTLLIAEDAVTVSVLFDALADRLAASGLPGEWTTGSRDPGLKINLRAVDARIAIRHILVAWTTFIAETRGVTLPDDDTESLGTFVARHAAWLAAQPDTAAAVSTELQTLVREAHPIAYPSGVRVFDVAPCPTQECPGTLRAVLRRSDSLLPAAVVCDRDNAHTWTADRWLALGRQIRGAA